MQITMDIKHPDYSLQAKPSVLQNVLGGLRKIFVSDPSVTIQLLLTILVVSGGIVLQLNAIQWVLVLTVTSLFVVAGIFRGAALLQVKSDSSISSFQASRIKCMGNILLTITAGISLFTYMMVFIPKIVQLP